MDSIKFLTKYWILLAIIIGIPVILLFGYTYVKTSFRILDYLERENHNYLMIHNKDSINGLIDSVYSSHGGAFVTLKNSNKIWFEVTENRLYEKYLLCDFLQPNDSLYKKADNDTLFVFRNRKFYFFKLGQLHNSLKTNK